MKGLGLMSAAALFALPIANAHAVAPQHPQGPHWSGYGLEGYRFTSAFPPPLNKPIEGTGPNGKLTLTALRCDPAGTTKKASPASPRAYRCAVKASQKICAGGDGPATPVVLVEGTWPTQANWSAGDVTASCSVENIDDNEQWKAAFTGSLAKCVEIWDMNTDWKHLTACVHMARAAYGADASYTFPGTMVDAWDDEPAGVTPQHETGCKMVAANAAKHGNQKSDLCQMWLEAEWDERGAVCVNHLRYLTLQEKPKGKDTAGKWKSHFSKTVAPAAAGVPQLHCRPDAPGTAMRGALLRNRSRLNDPETGKPPPLPSGQRSEWDTPDCVKLCPSIRAER